MRWFLAAVFMLYLSFSLSAHEHRGGGCHRGGHGHHGRHGCGGGVVVIGNGGDGCRYPGHYVWAWVWEEIRPGHFEWCWRRFWVND